ncbi:hypothetical protein TNCV_2368361 [Trichonephila clavipes]|nr:hypothetical protein TNCV_2368361 [Trichonephila clavipes]
MSLNSGSVSRDMAPSSRKFFCCFVPLTSMRPPRPIWLNLTLTQKDRYSTDLGNGACTERRRSCSWGLPGMIHHPHLGIGAIAGNRGNEEFDGHWLYLVTLA